MKRTHLLVSFQFESIRQRCYIETNQVMHVLHIALCASKCFNSFGKGICFLIIGYMSSLIYISEIKAFHTRRNYQKLLVLCLCFTDLSKYIIFVCVCVCYFQFECFYKGHHHPLYTNKNELNVTDLGSAHLK